ncbi:MAG TPA: methyltransferase domain-containing protein [Candidatus Nanoarchaeia archaeon]|nr:methyltransferase domain-containing protein [Candidatus Nanoarchaeia archaeon]
MSLEKIVQFLNRKPTELEIKELLNFGVIEPHQVQDLRNLAADMGQTFQLRGDQKLAIVQLGKERIVFVDDDTGSGKTAIAIKGIQHLEEEVIGEPIKTLIFSPNTIKTQWNRRVLGYLPEGYIRPDEITVIGEENGNGNGFDRILDSRIVIINYERIASDPGLAPILQQSGFTFVNFDEFQKAKNHKGKTSRYLKQATEGIPFRMATTRSPYRKSLIEPANLLAILDPEYFRKEQQLEIERNPAYAQDYENMSQNQRDDLTKFIIDKFVKGSDVADIGPLRSQYGRLKRKGIRKSTEDLTGKRISLDYEVGAYDLSEAEARLYEMFRNADIHFPEVHLQGTEKLDILRHILRDASVLTPDFVRQKLEARKAKKEKSGREYSSIYTKLNQIFEAHPEMRNLGSIHSSRYQALRNVLDHIGKDEEVVIFTDKKYIVVDTIGDIVNEHYGPHSAVKITGDESTGIENGKHFSDREISMLKFQVSGVKKAAVATQQTAGEGVRFDRARNVILFELPYTWDDVKQMIGRAESPYQANDINVYVVNERTRLDQGIIELIKYRKKVGERFLKGTDELTKEEILENMVDKSTADEPRIRPFIRSDLEKLLMLLGSMRDKGFEENYRILKQTEIGGEKASHFFARVYESFLENSLPGNMARLIAQIVSGIGGKGNLADMGSATSFLGRNLLASGLPISVFNLDMNYDALAHGKGIAEVKGLKQEYIASDMGKSPFEPNSFDYVIASMSLNHQNLDQRMTSLKEMFRTTKKGGYVIIGERDNYLTEEQKKRFFSGLETLGARVAKISGFYTSKEGTFNAFIAVAQKVSEPYDEINPEDFLYSNKQFRSGRGTLKEWNPKGQRCETFIHEDGNPLEKKIADYRVEEQKRTNELRVMGYKINILDEDEARKYHFRRFRRRFPDDATFISVGEKEVFVYRPDLPRDNVAGVVRRMLLDYGKIGK